MVVKNRGFTLIELLVVIAVIAVLMSILMPVLGKVRKQAYGTVCQSNLRTIGLAVAMFADDNDGKVCRGMGEPRWFMEYMRYMKEDFEDGNFRRVKYYRCKAYPDKRQMVAYVVNAWSKDTWSGTFNEVSGLFKTLNIRDRANTIYIADAEDGPHRPIIENEQDGLGDMDVWHPDHLPAPEHNTSNRAARARHKNGHNALFWDWHVGYVEAEDSNREMWVVRTKRGRPGALSAPW